MIKIKQRLYNGLIKKNKRKNGEGRIMKFFLSSGTVILGI